MKKNIDDKCRVIIPLDFRKKLNIEPNQEVDIELIDKKIVISNSNDIMSKNEIETMYENICKLDKTEYNKGFQDAFKKILNR